MDKQAEGEAVLDVAAAIRRLLDNRLLYRALLLEFQRHHRGDPERLRAKLAAGDRQGGISVVHSLRGAARFIGARRLELTAERLERGLRSDEFSELHPQVDDLDVSLAEVLAQAELELCRSQ